MTAAGWRVVDVLLHLAQTEEAAVATVTGTSHNVPVTGAPGAATVDGLRAVVVGP